MIMIVSFNVKPDEPLYTTDKKNPKKLTFTPHTTPETAFSRLKFPGPGLLPPPAANLTPNKLTIYDFLTG